MDAVWLELTRDFHATHAQVARVVVRLLAAVLLASIVGAQRERSHKAAGLRTHLLVALGAAMFTLIPLEANVSDADVTRVIQGIATGIGFIGGGVILKLTESRQVKGLTTAASIWLVAALGVAAGSGHLGIGLAAMILSWIVLVVLRPLDRRLDPPHEPQHDAP